MTVDMSGYEKCAECGQARYSHTGSYHSIPGVCYGFTLVATETEATP